VDSWLLPTIFNFQLDENNKLKLVPVYLAYGALPVGSPMRIVAERGKDYFLAHSALEKEDPQYAVAFAGLERDAIETLGPRATLRTGREYIYREALTRGIYTKLVTKLLQMVGAPTIDTLPPPFDKADRFGIDSLPFTSSYSGDLDNFPESVLPFHYCSGMASGDSHGITISGGKSGNLFVRAHQQLLTTDESYGDRYNQILTTFIDRASRVDPFDPVATSTITRDFRRALIDAGLSDKITKQVGNSGLAAR